MTVTPASVASVAARCLRTPGTIAPDTPLALLGLDSLTTIEMVAELEAAFGCELPADVLIECTDVRSIADLISTRRAAEGTSLREDPFDGMIADATLPPDVLPVVSTGASTDLRSARRILLTGATGFLGGAILEELLSTTTAEIVCLVRDPARWRRLADEPSGTRVRIIAVRGDLSHARFGLGDERFNALGAGVDAVVHCGAAVNWVYTYNGLRGSNVSGTIEMLRLASRRGIPFHFISSLSVCYPLDGPASVDESYDGLAHLRGVHLGYAQSKVVSEALVREAGRRGLPVRIYRPALISGHAKTGAFNGDDLITALVRGCVEMGSAPDLDWNLDCQPVDYVARAIVELSGKPGPTFHLGHSRPRAWRECVLWMRIYGYRIRLVSYHAWLRQLERETGPSNPTAAAHPLRALRTFFLNRQADAHGLTFPELYEESRRTAASSADTLRILSGAGVESPPLDASLLGTYFARFRADGVLPDPYVAQPFTAASMTDDAQPLSAAPMTAPFFTALLNRPVTRAVILDSGSDHSIVSELTAWRSRRMTGLFRAEVTFADGETRQLRVKSKAADTDVIAVGEALADLVDPAAGHAYARWSDRIGFTASHVREIEIYRQTDPRFVRHAPASLGSLRDDATGSWVLALEELNGATLLNAVDTPGPWTNDSIDVVLDGLGSLHALWYGREAQLRDLPWIGYVQSADGMTEMSDLWTALAAHAAPSFSSWVAPDIAALQRRLISSAGEWWCHLETGPRTLIHHDFNPRNVCLRNGELCAYDWELATVGAPQRDLAELLLFVLPADGVADNVHGWVQRYRQILQQKTGATIDPEGWRRGFAASLYDLLINRLSIYAMVHRVRRQTFLPRIMRTWRALYEQFPLEPRS